MLGTILGVTFRDGAFWLVGAASGLAVGLLKSSLDRMTARSEERSRSAQRICRATRRTADALVTWARESAGGAAVTSNVVEGAQDRLAYGETLRGEWTRLDDPEVEQALREWHERVASEVTFALAYLRQDGAGRRGREDYAEAIHRWIGQPSDVASLGGDGGDLADAIEKEGRPWIVRIAVSGWRRLGRWWAGLRHGSAIRLDHEA